MTYLSRKRDRQWYVAQYLKFLHHSVAEQLGEPADFTSDLQAALTCAAPAVLGAAPGWQDWLLAAGDPFTTDVVNRLIADGPALEGQATSVAIHAGTGPDSHLWHLYELFVGGAGKERKVRGVYYTPPAVARYVVAHADQALREHCGLPEGLSGELPFHVLEPACGSGAFIAAVVEHVQTAHALDLASAAQLVTRIIAIDISPVATLLTRLRLAVLLQNAGIPLSADFPQPQILAGDALLGPVNISALAQPIGVVLGNPPFSYLSRNDQPWIQALVRGDDEHAGYFAIDDLELGEKKTWLHDDYVKFIRLAQWCIEQNGSGVASLVTNHGWLDNATFRIARQQLLRTFDRIEVVDLHGNAKRYEVVPAGESNENVFGIAQGIALATFTKSTSPSEASIARSDLWGTRSAKIDRLARAIDGERLPQTQFTPIQPWFAFVADQPSVPREYESAPLLTELMPVNSTVPVTARDHFVVANTREELLARITHFTDPSVSDARIRAKYFQRTRSHRYEPGDTRSWKLPAARQAIREAGDPQQFIRRCLYRPFVWRYVFWHPAMIDWPRTEFTRHLEHGNLALLARRQSIAGREANFFWVTDCLPLDGVIRSDNRGSESFFPLRLYPTHAEQEPALNFSKGLCGEFEPAKMFAYAYGLFHAPGYRTRYATALGMEFPRILLPRNHELFERIGELGSQLIKIHLTDPLYTKITIHRDVRLITQIENFHVGTYNVCRKWLQMEHQQRESPEFAGLQQLICHTLQVQEQIEETIASAGGFPQAFRELEFRL